MKRVITEWLDEAAYLAPEKEAFIDDIRTLTFSALREEALRIAYALSAYRVQRRPVAVYLEKSASCVAAMFGASYAGAFYTTLDTEMPDARIALILDVLAPAVIITDASHRQDISRAAKDIPVCTLEETTDATSCTLPQVIPADICYVLFTSGSTGIPKGIVTPHKALVDYIDAAVRAYSITDKDIIANQAPFYFVLSIIDIFAAVKCRATTYILPHKLFYAPARLVKKVAETNATILNWVSSALILVARTNAFTAADLSSVRLVIFGGEVMPVKMLNLWIDALPAITYVNAYGSTEITDGCAYYCVDRTFAETETFPLGIPFDHTELLLIDDEGREITKDSGETGTLFVRSTSVAYGYYNDPERTKTAFLQNPLHHRFPDIVYRTGDLARYNEHGELVYAGRADFQIKRRGHRVELGEIETAAGAFPAVDACCCLYHEEGQRILLLCTGHADGKALSSHLKAHLPVYMIPDRILMQDAFPYNLNGKIDRAKLKEGFETLWNSSSH